LSWILFNQGAKHITALQGEQLNRSLSEFTKGGTKNPLAELQGRLGIDRIDLDRRGLTGEEEVSLKLGKYLSKNLFVGVSKGINSDVNRIGFEASLNEHWKVQGEIGDNSQGQMHLKWKTDY
jgi:translocation and assembly module TamB